MPYNCAHQSFQIATWNINNRVGVVPFRPEAAEAASALGVDIIVLTEFFPQHHEERFRKVIAQGGWPYQIISIGSDERANRVLVAAKVPIGCLEEPALPTFDGQFSPNIVVFKVIDFGVSVIAQQDGAVKSITFSRRGIVHYMRPLALQSSAVIPSRAEIERLPTTRR